MAMEKQQTISVPEAGKLLNVSRATAYNAAKSGQLPVIRLGRRIVVPLRALEAMLAGERREASK